MTEDYPSNGECVTEREFNRFIQDYKEDMKSLKEDIKIVHRENLKANSSLRNWMLYLTVAVVVVGGSTVAHIFGTL